MSTDIYDDDGIIVTRYGGPGVTPGPHRLRYQCSWEITLTVDDLYYMAQKLETLAIALRAEHFHPPRCPSNLDRQRQREPGGSWAASEPLNLVLE